MKQGKIMNSIKRLAPYDEVNLLARASGGNLEAFNQLVLIYQDMAYDYAYSILGESALAEDVTQESFIKASRSMHLFRGGSYRSWLLKIITNSAYDVLGRSQRHPAQSLFPADKDGEEKASPAWIADPTGSIQDIVGQNELLRSIHKWMEELPEPYRTVLTLIDVYELDYGEAADALNLPMDTIKSQLARARNQMGELLRQLKNTPLCLYCLA
jgi:RNA polymerase sigma-70 factor (ECF subfamily)